MAQLVTALVFAGAVGLVLVQSPSRVEGMVAGRATAPCPPGGDPVAAPAVEVT